jgi:hypothetical protein
VRYTWLPQVVFVIPQRLQNLVQNDIAPVARYLLAGLDSSPLEPEKVPRQRNLWVTDTVEWCRETRLTFPLPDGEGFGSFS